MDLKLVFDWNIGFYHCIIEHQHSTLYSTDYSIAGHFLSLCLWMHLCVQHYWQLFLFMQQILSNDHVKRKLLWFTCTQRQSLYCSSLWRGELAAAHQESNLTYWCCVAGTDLTNKANWWQELLYPFSWSVFDDLLANVLYRHFSFSWMR